MIKIKSKFNFKPEDVIFTYSEIDIKKSKQYKKVMELKKKKLRECEIFKSLNIPRSRVNIWLNGRKPLPIKSEEIIKEKRWLSSSKNSEGFLTIVDIFSWIYGDGNLNKNGNPLLFGQYRDLKLMGKKISKFLGLKYKIEYDPFVGVKTNKNTSRLTIIGKRNIFGRMLMVLGSPIGSKVRSEFLLPEWLLKSNLKIKKRFLEVFFSNEITVRRLEKNNKLPNFDLRIDKSKKYIKNGIKFMKQIRDIINEFGIKTTGPRIKENNDRETFTITLTIPKNMINLYRFYETFNLRYSIKKQKNLTKTGIFIKRKLKKHLQNIQDYKTVRCMNKKGFGWRRLSKMLNRSPGTINRWIYQDIKPLFIDKENYIKGLIKK